MAVKVVDLVLLFTRVASLALASVALALFKQTFYQYSSFNIASLAQFFHITTVSIEIAGQFVCFSRGTRPVPQDRALCFLVLGVDWVVAVLTYGSAIGTIGITLQMHRSKALVSKVLVKWLEVNMTYGLIGLSAGICATATAICNMSIASRSGPLQFNNQHQH